MKPRFLAVLFLLLPCALGAEETLGYYRFPPSTATRSCSPRRGTSGASGRQGGTATRLTTHPAEESRPALSPDGRTLAFSAAYEGPTEVYTMPIDGGLPVRRTFDGEDARVVGWTPGGEILYATAHRSGLPLTGSSCGSIRRPARRALLPLAQAAEGAFTPDGRPCSSPASPSRGATPSATAAARPRASGGFREGEAEAVPLTADFPGTSREPMVWQGRVYFVSDRDGTMNLWSMDENGGGSQAAHLPPWLGRDLARRSPTAGSSISSAPTCGSTTSPPARTRRSPSAWSPTSTRCGRPGSRSRWTT